MYQLRLPFPAFILKRRFRGLLGAACLAYQNESPLQQRNDADFYKRDIALIYLGKRGLRYQEATEKSEEAVSASFKLQFLLKMRKCRDFKHV